MDPYQGIEPTDKVRRLRAVWARMNQRCGPYENNVRSYEGYYARGVRVSKRWSNPETGFRAFYEDLHDTWFPGAQLSRIADTGDYSPGNCRWLTPLDNQHEKQNVTQYLIEGEYYYVSDIIRRCPGIKYSTVFQRLKSGDRTWARLSRPTRKIRPRRTYCIEGEWLSLSAIQERCPEVPYTTLQSRLARRDYTWARLRRPADRIRRRK